jgi:putative ABC transport system permease protein
MRVIFMEAGSVSLLAGLLGYGIGTGGVWAGMRLFGGTSAPPFHPDPLLALLAIGLAVIVGLAASAYPAALVARMDPNQALKTL